MIEGLARSGSLVSEDNLEDRHRVDASPARETGDALVDTPGPNPSSPDIQCLTSALRPHLNCCLLFISPLTLTSLHWLSSLFLPPSNTISTVRWSAPFCRHLSHELQRDIPVILGCPAARHRRATEPSTSPWFSGCLRQFCYSVLLLRRASELRIIQARGPCRRRIVNGFFLAVLLRQFTLK